MSQRYRLPFNVVSSQIEQIGILSTLARLSERVIRHIEFPIIPISLFSPWCFAEGEDKKWRTVHGKWQ